MTSGPVELVCDWRLVLERASLRLFFLSHQRTKSSKSDIHTIQSLARAYASEGMELLEALLTLSPILFSFVAALFIPRLCHVGAIIERALQI